MGEENESARHLAYKEEYIAEALKSYDEEDEGTSPSAFRSFVRNKPGFPSILARVIR